MVAGTVELTTIVGAMSTGGDEVVTYRGKRALDLALVVASAPITIPLAAAAALAVRLDGPGPVLFHQERVGAAGRPFRLHKFRTMVHGDNPIVPDPDRITRVGAFLRATSLDELPQLINVLTGEMSLVGPRPTLAYQVERYTGRQRGRLRARPGLTGRAQVRLRNAAPWAARIEEDLAYIDEMSLFVDLRLILDTVRQIVGGRSVDGHDPADPLVAIDASGQGPAAA